MKGKFLFGLALLALGVTSCKDEPVFDQDNYNNLVWNSFPVKNVDPSQDWATVGSATAEVSINMDYGVTYDVGLYLDNPIGSKQATRVYEKKVKSGETLSTTFSYKLASPVVYIGIFDQQGRGMAQAVKIENGRAVANINTNVSTSARQRASEDASVYSQYVKTVNDYLNPEKDLWGNTLNTKQISVAEMKTYTTFTDADLASNNTLTNGIWDHWDAEKNENVYRYIGGSDGHHFRVASGTEITSVFNVNGTYGIYNDVVVYIEGKVHLNGNTLNGPTLVVANGGEIVVDGNTQMSNAGRIVVLPGGKMTGAAGVTYNVSNGAPGYNAGTIEFAGELNVNGSDFYNSADGTIKVDVLRNTSGGKFTNFGTIEARTNTQAGDTYNSVVINGCHMKFTADAGIGTLTMLDNSRLDVAGKAEFAGTQTLYNHSVINAGSLYVTNTVFSGPTADGQFAIVKTGKIYIGRSGDITAQNNTYFDWDKSEIYHKDNGKYEDYETNPWSEGYGATHYQVTKYIDESTVLSSFTIPAGKCTGDGYNDGGNPGGGKPEETTPLSFRFMFEDNFPDAGDYDFNDAVIKITPVVDANNSKKVTVTVNLEATGASKTNGAAIRLFGITASMLSSYQCTQALPVPPANLGTYENIPDGTFTTSRDPNDGSSLVMLLCKDVHYALNTTTSGNGGVQRLFYNTPLEGWTNYGHANVKTAVYEFTFNSETDAQKLLDQATYDAFIVEPYNGSYWEVHTVQNNRKGALVLHPEVHINSYQEYLNAYVNSAIGNLPWAVMVPGTVEYPLEGRNIKVAYPNFEGWAQDHTSNTNWYESPAEGNTFPLSLIY